MNKTQVISLCRTHLVALHDILREGAERHCADTHGCGWYGNEDETEYDGAMGYQCPACGDCTNKPFVSGAMTYEGLAKIDLTERIRVAKNLTMISILLTSIDPTKWVNFEVVGGGINTHMGMRVSDNASLGVDDGCFVGMYGSENWVHFHDKDKFEYTTVRDWVYGLESIVRKLEKEDD